MASFSIRHRNGDRLIATERLDVLPAGVRSTVVAPGEETAVTTHGGAAAREEALGAAVGLWTQSLLHMPGGGELHSDLLDASGNVLVDGAPSIGPIEKRIRQDWDAAAS